MTDNREDLPVWHDSTPTGLLLAAGSGLLRAWHRGEGDRTEILRDLALIIVKLRSRFYTDTGIDWAGRSWDYRQTVAQLYDDAGLNPEEMTTVQAALRYHVGNTLRDTVPAELLEAAGLKAKSPKERFRDSRAEMTAAYRALQSEQGPEARVRMWRSLGAAQHALRLALEQTADLDPAAARTQLEAAEDLSADLQALILKLKTLQPEA